jgi:cytochrome c-type biogenesis protein CcsB
MRSALAIDHTIPPVVGSARREKAEGWPVLTVSVATGLALVALRMALGPSGVVTQGGLVTLALVALVSGSALLVTNVALADRTLDRVGVAAASLAFSFMFGSWMVRWIDAGDQEGWLGGRIWRYVPLDNLYALTLGFATFAAFATLVLIRTRTYRALGAMALPLVTLVLVVATLLDSEIHRLPPILGSYWLPIHVTTATVAYGVALASFGVALAYLVKDGLRPETVAIATSAFGLLVYGTIARSGVVLGAAYSASVSVDHTVYPLRASLPLAGPAMALAAALLVATLVAFARESRRHDAKSRAVAWRLFAAASAAQGVALAVLGYALATVGNPASRIAASEYPAFGKWLAKQMQLDIASSQYAQLAENWIRLNGANLAVGFKSNPIELGALITVGVALALTGLFAWKREALAAALPPAETLDLTLYRSVAVVLPLLTLVLVTGAVWANESWGRYWGWDPKEVGALVSWIAYAGYLHARITHGWTGRRSAYFALVGFALVIFTWLGVTFLLPGLHSYA